MLLDLSPSEINNIKEKDMKVETDWKLIFVLEFDTLLFELKLLRPAFVLLFALLPTISVFYQNN